LGASFAVTLVSYRSPLIDLNNLEAGDMKAIVVNTLDFNINYLLPLDERDCKGLLESLFTTDYLGEDFSRRKMAIELIFDEVEDFNPDEMLHEDDKYPLIKKLKSFVQSLEKPLQYVPEDVVAPLRENDIFNDEDFDEMSDILRLASPSIQSFQENALVLSPDIFFTQQYLAERKINNRETSLGILAAAGIEFCMPSIFCKDKEVVYELKEKFSEERLEYLDYLTKHLEIVHAELDSKTPDFDEIWNYAQSKISLPLKIRAEKFEVAVGKAGEKVKNGLVKRAMDSIPAIGSALVSGSGNLQSTIAIEILKILCGSINKATAYEELKEKHPEASYIYKMRTRVRET